MLQCIFTGLLSISTINMGFGVCYPVSEYRGTVSFVLIMVKI